MSEKKDITLNIPPCSKFSSDNNLSVKGKLPYCDCNGCQTGESSCSRFTLRRLSTELSLELPTFLKKSPIIPRTPSYLSKSPRSFSGTSDFSASEDIMREYISSSPYMGETWVSLGDFDKQGRVRDSSVTQVHLPSPEQILGRITRRLRFVLLLSIICTICIVIIAFVQKSFVLACITFVWTAFYLCLYFWSCRKYRFSLSSFLSQDKLRLITHSIGFTYFLLCGIIIYIHTFYFLAMYLMLVPLILFYTLKFNFVTETLLWGIFAVLADAIYQSIAYSQGQNNCPLEITISRIFINFILTCFLLMNENKTFHKIKKLQNREEKFVNQTKALRIARETAFMRANELKVARDKAVRSEQIKSDFLSNMSHEIRTPMTGVLGLTEMLMQTELTEEQREDLDTINRSGKSLLVIINDILDFGKIEAKKMELESICFDPLVCVETVLEILGPKAYKKKIELICHLKRGLTSDVMGDATRVKQILINLVGNAIKFTEKGRVLVTIDVEPTKELVRHSYQLHMGSHKIDPVIGISEIMEKKYIYFTVKDDGIGILKDMQTYLFSRYTQAEKGTCRKFGGTGLGLMISLRLTEMMGGHMWVESDLGNGATFHFTIAVDEVSPRIVQLVTPTSGTALLAPTSKKSSNHLITSMRLDEALLRSSLGSRSLSLLVSNEQEDKKHSDSTIRLQGMHVGILEDDAVANALSDLCHSWGFHTTLIPRSHKPFRKKEFEKKFDFMILHIKDMKTNFPGSLKNKKKTSFIITSYNHQDFAEFKDDKRVLGSLLKPIKAKKILKVFCKKFDEHQRVTKIPNMRKGNEKYKKTSLKKKKKMWSTLQILVVEDNCINQKVIKKMLTHLRYKCDIACDGLDAVKKVKEKFYHVILMDLQMPRMGGLQASQLIRQYQAKMNSSNSQSNSQPKFSKIFALTASVLKAERDACEAAGMPHLSKPFKMEQLKKVLAACARDFNNRICVNGHNYQMPLGCAQCKVASNPRKMITPNNNTYQGCTSDNITEETKTKCIIKIDKVYSSRTKPIIVNI